MNLTADPLFCSLEASALWLEKPGEAALRQEHLPQPADDQIVLRSRFGAISRGTEALVFKGQVPESEWQRMECLHQDGDFGFPVKYGYCLVGEIEAGPHDMIGKRGFCLHPHQTRALLKVETFHPIPEAVPSRRAVLAANMETALNIVWDAGIATGTRLCVFGAGVVGLLVARIAAKIPGVQVTMVDIDDAKQEIAEAFGCRFANADTLSGEFDVLVNVSASGEALQLAIDNAALEAKIVEASWYGEKTVELRLGGPFHSKRLSIISSQVGLVAASRRGQVDAKRRMQIALSLLDDPLLDLLFSGETPFDALPARYGVILADKSTLCHRVIY
ncbi:zinc-dependent alcohol dehydrogenase [Limoniibacter endophyticus]|uniref:Dehydrogenase n=1 Tax=Limoniibacter endophyticus TaxID=1565040 RepID=A0A8J3DNU3_9HYPH|nr:zinc-binding alcohol dehydrogenase [Limoniibacter endophyticus]GHC69123.1 dehydrogenase [Limoniibacter endophyticus]